MEILNQNQRRSAFWRLFFLGFIVLAIASLIIIRTHLAYAELGDGALRECERNYEEDRQKWLGKKQGLQNKIKELEQEIAALKASEKNPNELVQICEARLKQREDRIKDLEKDLELCQQEVSATDIN